MLSRSGILTVFLIFVMSAHSVIAAEIFVRKDGTGHFTTVHDAVAAAVANDIITVGPGTYAEPFMDISIPIHIRSEYGADMTVLDGRDMNRIFRFYDLTRIEGFTFANGRAVAVAPNGGAIVAGENSDVQIDRCKFLNNTADAGGALYVTKATTQVTLTDCAFENNYAPVIGGAINVVLGSVLNVEYCSFSNNSTDIWGGAINVGEESTLNVAQCLFNNNTSGDVAGAIYMFRAYGTIQTSTFWQNHSPGILSGTLTIQECSPVMVTRNIIAEDTGGYGLFYIYYETLHNCNVFWNNTAGPIIGGSLASDEAVSNPLFCDPDMGSFLLYSISPAAPEFSACGLLVGAFDVGCSAVSTEESSWGRIKSMHNQ